LVWATGNTSRDITRNLMGKLPQAQTQRRGIVVDDYLSMIGADGIYAVGDCTATSYAPTAQVASQQGMYLAQMFGKLGQKAKLERQLAEQRAAGAEPQEIESSAKKLTRLAKLTPFHYSHQVGFPSKHLEYALTSRDPSPTLDLIRQSPIYLFSTETSLPEVLLPCGSGVPLTL
jgi:NADH dehydrogenase FAD-containing subunit